MTIHEMAEVNSRLTLATNNVKRNLQMDHFGLPIGISSGFVY